VNKVNDFVDFFRTEVQFHPEIGTYVRSQLADLMGPKENTFVFLGRFGITVLL